MENDEIVEEVRKFRREIEDECDNDFRKIFERVEQSQKITIKERIAKLERMKTHEIIVA